jgi:ABC-type multidrug transport system fused ATPase/permease subunit
MPTKDNNNTYISGNYGTFIQALWYFLGSKKYWFLVWVAMFATAQVLFIVYLELTANLINQLVNYNNTKNIQPALVTVGLMILSVIFSGSIRIFAKEQINKISLTLQSRVKTEGMQKLMEFPISWHQKENSGNKVQRLNTGADQLKQFLNGFNNSVLPSSLNLILVCIIFAKLNYRYILFALVVTCLIYVNERFFIRRKAIIQQQILKIQEKNAGLQFETASNILTAKASDAISKINSRVADTEEEVLSLNLQKRGLVSQKWYIIHTMTGFTIGIFLYLIIQDYISGVLLIGNVSVMLSYYKQLRDSINDLVTSLDSIEENKISVNRMYPIFTEKPEVYFGHDSFPIDWNSINIKEASFAYPAKEGEEVNAIIDLNFDINRKDRIGIVGHSGSGKSTLAKLLIGLYKLENGSFKVGDKNYYDIEHKAITDNIAIVLQDTEMFNMSFKENVTLLKSFDKIRFEKAISLAQLNDVVNNLPQGLETTIGEKGYKLSGGQRQRLGIARAIYADTPIIIFDEATSALDTNTERLIQDALDTQLGEKTLIFIAHRLSTLKNMSRIVVFENGKVIEDGLFDELLSNKQSIFYELWNQQGKMNETKVNNDL